MVLYLTVLPTTLDSFPLYDVQSIETYQDFKERWMHHDVIAQQDGATVFS